jgi:hypothetical protein
VTHPEPTPQDIANAATRQAIADRQAKEYAKATRLALGALGPNWHPWMKLVLLDSDYHNTGNTTPIAVAYKFHRGEKRLSEHSVFLRQMPDGSVQKASSYETLFGELLTEPHPTRGFEQKGQWCPYPRWTLCWSALELYAPKSAENLAALRESRERGKAEREEKKWAEENPLLKWAEDGRGR